MTAKVGKAVVVHGVLGNGHRDQPGVITSVHSFGANATWPQSSAYINAKVFPDCGNPEDRTSIPYYEDGDVMEKAKDDGAEVFAVPVD